ncbi:MAG: carbon-nitrogen hydrolase [Firmicutes bacterium HGW-Firmicutes-13]|nr:MAG: carbon-nitrogen hydrolase [Firmicutes bacterium HGW-Firmicutes-13]
MRAVLVQAHIEKAEPDINRRNIFNLLKKALNEKPDLIMLPELWNTGYTDKISILSDNSGEPSLSYLTSFAREHNVNIAGGSIANNIDGKTFNHSYVISRQGEIVASYAKVHLFSLNREQEYFYPGTGRCLFYLDNIPCGLLICYDLRFPEFSRSLVMDGAQLLLVAAQWPRSRINAWRFLVGARAAENQIFVLANNRGGREGSLTFGSSMAVNPNGEILKEAGEEEETMTVDIDIKEVSEAREKIFYIKDRRPELYKLF